jgi:nucleoside 2-deoxyribosyltransferase
MKTRVYLAGPLFTNAERAWNDWLAGALRQRGFNVILPQAEATRHISPAGIDFAAIFTTCLEGVGSANVVVAVFDGPDVDSGTAFECGYAYARGIPIVGLRTDLRSGGEENGLNAMLSRSCQEIVSVPAFNNADEIVNSIISALSSLKVGLVR